jgi:Flp pilus assembly protein TadG
MTPKRARSGLSRWSKDRRGVAALEFALVMPIFMILFLVGYEITQCMATYRKVSDCTNEVANILVQTTITNKAGIQAMGAASTQIMAPYPTANLNILMSEIQTDASNNATVTWSQAYPTGSLPTYATGSSFSITPASLSQPNSTYILVQTSYAYNYLAWIGTATGILNGVTSTTLSGQIYMIPRQSSTVVCTDC